MSELIRECGVRLSSCVGRNERKGILEKVKSGEWLLISERVGALNDAGARRCIPIGFSPRQLESEEVAGPGKWAFFSIDYDGVKNTAIRAANRLGSMGDQGRVFGVIPSVSLLLIGARIVPHYSVPLMAGLIGASEILKVWSVWRWSKKW